MKLELIKGQYNNGKEIFGIGKVVEVTDKEAKKLIKLGMARKSSGTPEVKAEVEAKVSK